MERRDLAFLTILIGATILFAPALGFGFVWDDREMIVTNPEVRDLATIPDVFTHNYFGDRANSELFRPLVNVSLALDYHLLGRDSRGRPDPFGFHLTNVLLHLAAAVLLWRLLRQISSRPWLPEAAALLFFAHPAATEPVGWIVARADLLALVLLLAVIRLHLAARRRPWLHGVALLAYLAAMFGKLSAGPAPLFVFLVEWLFLGLRPRQLLARANLWRYAAYLVPIAIYFAVRVSAMGSAFPETVGVTWRDANRVAGIFVGGALLFRSGFQILFPVGMCADYSADPVFDRRGLADLAAHWPVPLLAAAAASAIVLAILLRRRAPWLAFGVLWAAAGLLPVSQVVRIGAVMADRYLYLPAAGVAAALAAGIVALPRPSWRAPVFAAVLLSFAVLTGLRLPVWKNDLTMNADVLASYPGNVHAWNRKALAHAARAEPKKEEAAYREGLRLDPDNRYLLKNLGGLLIETGRFDEARSVLSFAFLLRQPRDRQKAAIGYNLGLVLEHLGALEEAKAILEEAVECRPPLGVAYDLLGRVSDRLRR